MDVRRKKILLVDDDALVRDLLLATLGDADFLIIQAGGGYEAIELARAERPDLVLLDISLPDMDGVEVCRLLRTDASAAAAKVIVLTASATICNEAAAIAIGADGFFAKPFSPADLLTKVYQALESPGEFDHSTEVAPWR